MFKNTLFQPKPVLVATVVALLVVVITATIYKDDAPLKQQANKPQTQKLESASKTIPETTTETVYNTTVKHLTTQQQELAIGDAKRTIQQAEVMITQGDQMLKEQGINTTAIQTAPVITQSMNSAASTRQANRHAQLQARLDELANKNQ